MTLPVLHVEGEAFEQGRQHGLALGEQIARNLDVYYDRFLREGQLERDEARSRAARYRSQLDAHPYSNALLGMARGSGQDPLDLLVLNMRYELLYYQYSVLPVGSADGCTSFAVLPSSSANGHLLLGQNWDWIPEVSGAVLHTREPDGLETLSFTEAGIVGGKIGLNSAGLGLTINGLLSRADEWSRVAMPFHVRCYEILRQRSLSSARDIVARAPRPCSANFGLAQVPDQILDIEAAPDSVREIAPVCGMTMHTNHFLDPALIGVVEPQSERRPHSFTRLARMRELLEARAPVGLGDLEASLRDHDNYPDSVCRHQHPDDPPEESCTTVVSVIMDLEARVLWLSDGPPCEHVYTPHSI